jgi:hypothetical protein
MYTHTHTHTKLACLLRANGLVEIRFLLFLGKPSPYAPSLCADAIFFVFCDAFSDTALQRARKRRMVLKPWRRRVEKGSVGDRGGQVLNLFLYF